MDTKVYSNPVSSSVLSLFLVLYAGLAAPKLPKPLAELFGNEIFRLVILVLIAYMSSRDASISIIAAISLIISLQTLSFHEANEVVTQTQAFRNIPENIHEGLQSLAMQPDFSQPAPFEEVFRIPGVRGSIMTGNPTGGGVPVQMLGQFRDMYGGMNEPPYSNVFMNYADGGIASLYD